MVLLRRLALLVSVGVGSAVLAGSARRRNRALADSTRRSYEDALRPARKRLGNKQLQAITKADVEQLKSWML